ncbi:nucleotidyltransferase family protein [candidate division WOR-3 bacterium]|nr:nucleotidyltransferase family protein [candidate division WOR-3 bacterium]
MKTKEEILKVLHNLKENLKIKYKIKEIGVFGSVMRGEQKGTSDIDILVEFEDDADLLDLVGIAQFLEEKLQQKVDVVSKRALREEIKETVLQEVQSL